MRLRDGLRSSLLIVAILLTVTPLAAAQSSSPNYKVNETFFGTGGNLDASSPHYKAKQAVGETTVGNAISSQYQMNAGFNTTNTELLEVAVTGGVYDMDALDTANTHTVNPVFAIRNYLSSGYVVRIAGPPPTEVGGGHQLAPLTIPTNPIPGVEQFGINLVDNSNPNVGADPTQLPDSTFGFGVAATGYDQVNKFKYVSGDIVASSPKSSGTTLYTMTAIADISTDTPAGAYGGHFSVIVVPTF